MKRFILLGAPLLALLAACNTDGSGVASIRQNLDDQNQAAVLSASDATAEDVNLIYASDLTIAGGASAAARSVAGVVSLGGWSFGGNCAYNATSGRFSCPAITQGSLTLTRDFAFFNGSNGAMAAYDPSTTASANFHFGVSGVHVADNGADTVSRDRSMTVSGLTGNETTRTWDGSGTRSDGGYRTEASVTRRYHTSDAVTFTSIVVALPRVDHPWPLSGSITREISGTGSVTKEGTERSFSVSRTVKITFDGTQFATVTVGGDSYTLDLAAGRASRK